MAACATRTVRDAATAHPVASQSASFILVFSGEIYGLSSLSIAVSSCVAAWSDRLNLDVTQHQG
jgi:hypothetical protein